MLICIVEGQVLVVVRLRMVKINHKIHLSFLFVQHFVREMNLVSSIREASPSRWTKMDPI